MLGVTATDDGSRTDGPRRAHDDPGSGIPSRPPVHLYGTIIPRYADATLLARRRLLRRAQLSDTCPRTRPKRLFPRSTQPRCIIDAARPLCVSSQESAAMSPLKGWP